MGKVYKAYDPTLDRNVAIKILPPEVLTDPSRVTRFVQEARAASALNHPHVMTVYDIGEHDGIRYIAMELIEGKTLRELLLSDRLDLRRALKIVLQVAEALTAAHAAGIVHRDLKPENIMVSSAGYAKVLDFGLAKLRIREQPPDEASATLAKDTVSGVVMGTAGYMSPEQALGKAVDHRSDIFSLGCILYELATGKRAFRGDSSVDTLHKIIHTEPEPIRTIKPDLPAELARIVRKALAKDPDERYQTMKDLAIDLRELLREIDTNPSATTAAVSPRRRSRVALLPALLAPILAAVIIVMWNRPDAVTPPARQAMKIQRVTASGKVTGASISPDGKFVAYTYSDQGEQSLWVRQMGTGQSLQLIAPERAAYWGTSFSPDGQIYFGLKRATPVTDGIFRISPLGGTPQKIIDEADSPPAFSPDGKRMAFLRAAFPTQRESSVIVANADGSDARPLATIQLPEVFAPIFYGAPSWSPDGKLVAAGAINYPAHRGRFVAIDVAGGAIHTIADPGWFVVGNVAWMPDQKGLVAIAGSTAGRSQVWYLPYQKGQQPSQITNDLFDYRQVTVTADGKSLMAVANDIAADLWIHEEGSSPKRITSAKMEGAHGVETLADGRIVFTSLESGKQDIWMMNSGGSGRTLITRDEHRNYVPVPTPDGQSIVYVSETSRRSEVCRMNLDGSGRRVLAATINNATIDVSPDGRWVAFEAIEDAAGKILSGATVARVSIDGGKPELLSTDQFSTRPTFAPDGSRLAAYGLKDTADVTRLVILPAKAGPVIKRIPFAQPTFRTMIRWTPEGDALIVNTAPSDRANLWRVPLDGSKPERLTNFQELTIMGFAPLRGGRKGWIVSRGDQSRDAVLITGFRPGE
jgi:Tol biopolymer transport system component